MVGQQAARTPGVLGYLRFAFHIASWLPGYVIKQDLQGDLTAGLTVGVVLIAQGVAYGMLTGMKAYFGLYAALMPASVYVVFGQSRQMNIGPFALVSILVESVVVPIKLDDVPGTNWTQGSGSPCVSAGDADGGSDEIDALCQAYIDMCLTLSVMVGVIYLAAYTLRYKQYGLGSLTEKLSPELMSAMITAASVIICCSQLKNVLGFHVPRNHVPVELAFAVSNIGCTNLVSVIVASVSFAILISIKKFNGSKRLALPIPEQLVVVLLSTSLVGGLSLAAEKAFEQCLDGSIDMLHTGGGPMPQGGGNCSALTSSCRKGNGMCSIAELCVCNAGWTGPFCDEPSSCVDLAARTGGLMRCVDTLGTVPQGLPSPHLPYQTLSSKRTWELFFPGAFIVAAVSFLLSTATAKTLAAKRKDDIDVNQELLALGVANVLGGLWQAYPAASSLSRSALANTAGANTPLWNVFAVLVIAVVLLWLVPLLTTLPNAALGAVIMMAFSSLLGKLREPVVMWKNQKFGELAVWVTTFVCTIVFGITVGILVGLPVSMAVAVRQAMRGGGAQKEELDYHTKQEYEKEGALREGLLCAEGDMQKTWGDDLLREIQQ